MSNLKPILSRRNLLKGVFAGAVIVAVTRLPGFVKKLNPLPRLFSQKHKLMGTWISVTVFARNEAKAQAAMHEALFEMKEVDRLMSIHRSDSEISRVNLKAGNDSLRVSDQVLEVVAHAKRVSTQTQGLYDPTILPLMRLFGFYGKAPSRFPSDREIQNVLASMGPSNIVIDERAQTLGLSKKGSALDLGSIAKGYALDRAVQALKKHEIQSALIDAGGNLYAMGAPYEDPDARSGWTVGIRNPQAKNAESFLKTLILRDRAVGTSGVDENFVKIGSTKIGHLFNAVTGRPVHEYLTCSPVTSTGIASDVLSTAGYILGKQKAEALFTNEAEFYFFS